ncbi:hypothetical protein BDV38DRAFT_268993 [Aspergillus pseudotamarii]|uniref:NAD(P)-binding protein n=1 Tax=Aspergillus pseudotamarii TaxID=132259 RepID=A0A5N6T3L8_ASPPS|nr:uncharacterized protein BDV38DRAFT_268993 [Aspergillus pseudotamarii]KAE8140904.1 hypothetical protein BDV38DRAFT_268993 [Aspergillus pseudotamarii]
MAQTTVLVTGANRGIGKGLVTAYLAKANTTVIATCREQSDQNTNELCSLTRGHGSNLIIVSLSLDKPDSVLDAVSQLQRHHSVSKVDIVIANAGVCNHYGPLERMADSDLISHFEVNTLGPMRLFRASLPLLQASSQPKFTYISSELASISGLEHSSSLTAAYGASKVASNYLVKKIDTEHPDVIAFSIDPGFVQTDMGNRGAQCNGLKKAPMTISEGVEGIVNQVDKASKTTTSGKFIKHDGEQVPW